MTREQREGPIQLCRAGHNTAQWEQPEAPMCLIQLLLSSPQLKFALLFYLINCFLISFDIWNLLIGGGEGVCCQAGQLCFISLEFFLRKHSSIHVIIIMYYVCNFMELTNQTIREDLCRPEKALVPLKSMGDSKDFTKALHNMVKGLCG